MAIIGQKGKQALGHCQPSMSPGSWHVCTLVTDQQIPRQKAQHEGTQNTLLDTHTHLALRSGHQQGDVGVLLLAQDGHCLFPVLDVHTIYLWRAKEQSRRPPELALGWALVEHPGLRQALELWQDGKKWKVPWEGAAWPVQEHVCSENSMEEI